MAKAFKWQNYLLFMTLFGPQLLIDLDCFAGNSDDPQDAPTTLYNQNLSRFYYDRERVDIGTGAQVGNVFLQGLAYIGDVALVIPLVSATKSLAEKRQYIESNILNEILPTEIDHRSGSSNARAKKFVFYEMLRERYQKKTLETYLRANGALAESESFDAVRKDQYLTKLSPQNQEIYRNLMRNERREIEEQIRALARRASVNAVPNEERSIAITNLLEFNKAIILSLSQEAVRISGDNLSVHEGFPENAVVNRTTNGLRRCLNKLRGSDSTDYARLCLKRFSEEIPIRLAREVFQAQIKDNLGSKLSPALVDLVVRDGAEVFDQCTWERYYEFPKILAELRIELAQTRNGRRREQLQDRIENLERSVQEIASPRPNLDKAVAKVCVMGAVLESVNTASRFTIAQQFREFLIGRPLGQKIREYEEKLQTCFTSKNLLTNSEPPVFNYSDLMPIQIPEFKLKLDECLRDLKREAGAEIARLKVQHNGQLGENVISYLEQDTTQGKKYYRRYFRNEKFYLQEISFSPDGTLRLLGNPQEDNSSLQLNPLSNSPLHQAQRSILDTFILCEQFQETLPPSQFDPSRCAGITKIKGIEEVFRAKLTDAISNTFPKNEHAAIRERLNQHLIQSLQNCFGNLLQDKLSTLSSHPENPLPYVESEAIVCAKQTIADNLQEILHQKLRDTGVSETKTQEEVEKLLGSLNKMLEALPPLTIEKMGDHMELFLRKVQEDLPQFVLATKTEEVFPDPDTPLRPREAQESPTHYDEYLREQDRNRANANTRQKINTVVGSYLSLSLNEHFQKHFDSAEEEAQDYENILGNMIKNGTLLSASAIFLQKIDELLGSDSSGLNEQSAQRQRAYLQCLGQSGALGLENLVAQCVQNLTPPIGDGRASSLLLRHTHHLLVCMNTTTQGAGNLDQKQIKLDRCLKSMSVSFAKDLVDKTLDRVSPSSSVGILTDAEKIRLKSQTFSCLNGIYDQIFDSQTNPAQNALREVYRHCHTRRTRSVLPATQLITFQNLADLGCSDEELFTALFLTPELHTGISMNEVKAAIGSCTDTLKRDATGEVKNEFVRNAERAVYPNGNSSPDALLFRQYLGRTFDFFSSLKDSALFPRTGVRAPDGEVSRTLLSLGNRMGISFKYDINQTGLTFNDLEAKMRELRNRAPPASKEELAQLIANSPFMRQVFKANMAAKLKEILTNKISTEFPPAQYPEVYEVINSITSSNFLDQLFDTNVETPTLEQLKNRLFQATVELDDLQWGFQHHQHDFSCHGEQSVYTDCRSGRVYRIGGECSEAREVLAAETILKRNIGQLQNEVNRRQVMEELKNALLDFFVNGNQSALDQVEDRIKPLVVQVLAYDHSTQSFTNQLMTALVNAGIKEHRNNLGYVIDNVDRIYLAYYGKDWASSEYSGTEKGREAYNYFVEQIFVGPAIGQVSDDEMKNRIQILKTKAKAAIMP